ncbi:MAG TPA: GTP-binding protein [Stellaceae bacterium]|nr:GTP-binding protein [Stellaceae bacterium]
MTAAPVPVTILTGFLGSGKTTLINRLLRERAEVRFAVIENEYGEIGVDAELLHRERDETIVELSNGCICCTVRGDLARALDGLARRRASCEIAFDHVLIETTGLADPGPLVRTFLAETRLLDLYYLDGVVTLVDALNGARILGQSPTARSQLGYADRILVTKPDQVEPSVMEGLVERLATMNATAEVRVVDLLGSSAGSIVDGLLDMRGYQLDRVRLPPPAVAEDRHHDARHHEAVSSVTYRADGELNSAQFDRALGRVADRFGQSLWRVKGIVAITGLRQRLIVQGVQGLIHTTLGTIWKPFEPRRSTLVLIGEELDRDWIVRQLQRSEAAGTPSAISLDVTHAR